MIYGFSPGFYRHWSFLPSTMQKKNRNILSLSDCNVTPKYPYNAIKGYEGSIGNDIGNFRLHTIGRGIMQFFYVTCSVLGESTECINIFPYTNLFLLSNITHFRKKSCIPSSYFISSFVSCRPTPPEWVNNSFIVSSYLAFS